MWNPTIFDDYVQLPHMIAVPQGLFLGNLHNVRTPIIPCEEFNEMHLRNFPTDKLELSKYQQEKLNSNFTKFIESLLGTLSLAKFIQMQLLKHLGNVQVVIQSPLATNFLIMCDNIK